jgi:tRNA dimethylallyltransferase
MAERDTAERDAAERGTNELAGMPPEIWVLAGPTASGKTAVALELAGLLAGRAAGAGGVEIISADARQIFRGMGVGVAQPTAAERARVPHHLVDCIDPLELYTAADFGRDARRLLVELAGRGVLPLVVGGSGLYLQALVEGLFAGPGQDAALRARFEERAEREGDGALHAELAEIDVETAARLHPHDRVRVIRALEVALLTGMPLSEHHRRQSRESSLAARTRYVVLDRDRGDLHRRIAARTAAMYEGGLVEEARALLARGLTREHPAYRTVGYAEAFVLLAGESSVAEAIEATCTATRQYARRQLIWFRSVRGAIWVTAEPGEEPAATARRIMAAVDAAAGAGDG